MKVYVDSDSKIKAVGSTEDTSLTELIINDDEDNPFNGWSSAKICAYKCAVENGHVIMMTPYVTSSALPYIDEVGKDSDEKTEALKILFGEEA